MQQKCSQKKSFKNFLKSLFFFSVQKYFDSEKKNANYCTLVGNAVHLLVCGTSWDTGGVWCCVHCVHGWARILSGEAQKGDQQIYLALSKIVLLIYSLG